MSDDGSVSEFGIPSFLYGVEDFEQKQALLLAYARSNTEEISLLKSKLKARDAMVQTLKAEKVLFSRQEDAIS